MKRTSLVILNIGLMLIMFSAYGNDMEINYFMLVVGAAFAAVGGIMLFNNRKGAKKGN